ncbi:MAG: mechanosensitive ion channel [Deltaproteobacteria bacterium]|nr:mechanosensitive ion channel [Deltaproteobacteria bacterium]MCW5805089.1 mechanosensitive ion channel [Deltaproteobacteria bacterium]
MTSELVWLIGLLLGVAVASALIARLRPDHRHRIRRLFAMYALYAVATGLVFAFDALGKPSWGNACATAAAVMQGLLLVSLTAAIVFSIALPRARVSLPAIASDLIVGLASVAATLVVLSQQGLDATNALVSGAVVSAVLAISLQSTLGNILGGVALQLDGSITEGDWIAWDNNKLGRVREVRWRHTVVETREFSTIIVPNAVLLATSITILGKRDGNPAPQRLAITFFVDFRYPPALVTRIVTEALRAAPLENVASEPPPQAICTDLAREAAREFIAYTVKYSILEIFDEEVTAGRIRGRIYTALRRAGISPSATPQLVFSEMTDEEMSRKRAARDAGQRLATLRQVHLFKMLTEEELQKLAAAMNQALYVPGELITRQGADGHWLYVLASGRVEVRTNVDPDGPGGEPGYPVYVANIEAPDFFGETALMTGEPRSADVIAKTDVECFRLPKDAFAAVLVGRPEVTEELSERLARRRIELIAARDGVQPSSARARSERERIVGAIRGFFGL